MFCCSNLKAFLFFPAQGRPPRDAFLRPNSFHLVIDTNGRRVQRQNHPWLFRRSENMNVRRHGVRIIQRSHPNKANGLRRHDVMTPQSNVAMGATNDFLPFAAVARRIDDNWFALKNLKAVFFDQRVDHKGRSRFTLAPATVATMNEHRPRQKAIAHMTASAASIKKQRRCRLHNIFSASFRCTFSVKKRGLTELYPREKKVV